MPRPGAKSDSGPRGLPTTLSLREEVGEQVVFADGRTEFQGELFAARTRDLEVTCGVFLPKNARVEVDLSQATPGGRRVAGVVRKIQGLDATPRYTIWIRLERAPQDELSKLRTALELRGVSASTTRGSNAAFTAGVPAWVAKLLDAGLLNAEQLESVLEESRTQGTDLETTLVDQGLVLQEQIAAATALDQGVSFVDAQACRIHLANQALVPEDLARRHHLFPLYFLDGVITLGMENPSNLAVVDQIRLRSNCQVDPCLATRAALDPLIERAYGSVAAGLAPETSPEELEEVADSTNAIVRMVRSLIEDAAREGVSDVHIEPERDKLRIRNRLDGILQERSVHPLAQHAPIVSRLKVLSKLDIAETRKPQDGHFSLRTSFGTVDVRVSTIPTVCGENVVLRLLLSDGKSIALEDLGMPLDTLLKLQEFLDHPNGMILVTGPTGSGKTSTLYAALDRLSTIERNVVTVEDPVEKRVPLLRQTEVNPKAGLTFASGLRSILRQDPDVIMVGEIRDQETAEISVQAALTGHLVLSTLHTNTAAGAIVRLSEMGIPPFMITSSLRAVLSQRLVRRICSDCKTEVEPEARLLRGLNIADDGTPLFGGAGCSRCSQSGYRGRVGIYEMLLLTPGLSSALLNGESRDAIEREAAEALVSSMRGDGVRKSYAGLTTLEEVARVAGLEHFAEERSAA